MFVLVCFLCLLEEKVPFLAIYEQNFHETHIEKEDEQAHHGRQILFPKETLLIFFFY